MAGAAITPRAMSARVRPSAKAQPVLEAYLLDFAGDLYGEEVEVEFIARFRADRPSPMERRWPHRCGRIAIRPARCLRPSSGTTPCAAFPWAARSSAATGLSATRLLERADERSVCARLLGESSWDHAPPRQRSKTKPAARAKSAPQRASLRRRNVKRQAKPSGESKDGESCRESRQVREVTSRQSQARERAAKARPVVKVEALLKSPAKPPQTGRDWSETLFLPKTDFPMKAGLPEREPELLKRWERLRLYERLRDEARGREKFILHDGPPYANGHLHIGTGAEQDPEGRHHPLATDDGQGRQLRAGLGLSRPAHRVEGRGGELSRQGQDQARPADADA